MRFGTHLELGRVSNLPTVWSNVLAASVLSGAALQTFAPLGLAIAGCSALYIGGMYLNDACDADVDAVERPERPIPSGRISQRTVVLASIGWFAGGAALIGMASALSPHGGLAWSLATLALLGCIVVYDLHHKHNRWGPVLMAACRALVYLVAGLALSGHVTTPLLVGAALAFAWIAGLTAFAKQEGGANRTRWPWPLAVLALPVLAALPAVSVAAVAAVTTAPSAWGQPALILTLGLALAILTGWARHRMRRRGPGDFPAAIGCLIAGVSLVDALAIARTDHAAAPVMAMACTACTVMTLLLQRRIAGT